MLKDQKAVLKTFGDEGGENPSKSNRQGHRRERLYRNGIPEWNEGVLRQLAWLDIVDGGVY